MEVQGFLTNAFFLLLPSYIVPLFCHDDRKSKCHLTSCIPCRKRTVYPLVRNGLQKAIRTVSNKIKCNQIKAKQNAPSQTKATCWRIIWGQNQINSNQIESKKIVSNQIKQNQSKSYQNLIKSTKSVQINPTAMNILQNSVSWTSPWI